MRKQLVVAFVGLAVALVLLYGGPRVFFLSTLVHADQQARIDRSADLVAAYLEDVPTSEEPVSEATLARLAGAGEQLVHETPAGERTTVPEGGGLEVDLSATRQLDGGGSVTLGLSDDLVHEAVFRAVLPLLVLGLALVAVSGLVGLVLARRLAAPFTFLATVAERLGQGKLDLEVPRLAVPEADAIGAALQDSSRRLDRMLRREREVAVYASHELRTPITALRLALEDVTLWPETPPSVGAELDRIVGEVDRFSAAVTSLLEESRDETLHDVEQLDLAEVVADAVRSWEPTARSHGRTLRLEPAAPLPLRLPRAGVVRALDLVLEQGCTVGSGGAVLVRVGVEATHVAVRVELPSAAGRAAAPEEAAGLVSALGGRLVVEQGPPPQVVLMLPRQDVSGPPLV